MRFNTLYFVENAQLTYANHKMGQMKRIFSMYINPAKAPF